MDSSFVVEYPENRNVQQVLGRVHTTGCDCRRNLRVDHAERLIIEHNHRSCRWKGNYQIIQVYC